MIKITERKGTVQLILAALMGAFVWVCFAQLSAPQVSIEIVTIDGVDHVRLSWEPVEDAESYNIYTSTEPYSVNWGDQIETVGDNVFIYTAPVNDDIARFYYVVAYPEQRMVLVDGDLFNGNVTIDPFYISKYLVTREEFRNVMGADWGFTNPTPGFHPDPTDDNYPANQLTWFDAVEYCNRLSMSERLEPLYSYLNFGTDPDEWPAGWQTHLNHFNVSCNWEGFGARSGYRLPTEAEWHHAANGGIHDPESNWLYGSPYKYAGSNDVNAVAWHSGNSNIGDGLGRRSHPVGSKLPNGLGIYDMSGNVFEWVWDMMGTTYPSGNDNPRGAVMNDYLVWRGGGWNSLSDYCDVSFRTYNGGPARSATLGFRIVRQYN